MPTIPMDLLLVATGFTGALTLLWLVRLLAAGRWARPAAEVTFGSAAGRAEAAVRAIAAARREVLLRARGLASRPIAQALIDAKLRGVGVEVLLDAANEHDAESDLPFLVEQGLPPFLEEGRALPGRVVIVVDAGTVVMGQLDEVGDLVVLREQADAAGAYRADFDSHKAQARAVPARTAAAPEDPSPAPASEPMAPPAEDVLTAVARGLATTEEEEPEVKAAAPVVTPAAAEMFARLRKEMAESGEPMEKKAG